MIRIGKHIITSAKTPKEGIKLFLSKFNINLIPKEYANLISQFETKDQDNKFSVYSIHKIKGLENDKIVFVICNSLLQVLLNIKNNYDKETNLLYVALTRTKSDLLFIILDNKKTISDFEKFDCNIENMMTNIGVEKAKLLNWIF